MSSVTANGMTIEYDMRGDGQPLLLVMGLGGQLTDWPDDFVDLLVAAGFQVIRHDNRDAGLSTELDWEPPSVRAVGAAMVTRRKPKADYLIGDMADDAAAVLDALDVPSAHIVGVSMGGMIAQAMAISHPTRVRSLTSIMSNTGDRRHGRPSPKVLAAFARRPEATRATALDASVDMYRLIAGPSFDEAGYRALAATSIARSWRPKGAARQMAAVVASPDRTTSLGRVTAPTLVVHGLADPLVRPSGGIATAKAIVGSRLLMFPEMGHDLPRPRWPELVEAITRNAQRAD